jgi:hypothetical protein
MAIAFLKNQPSTGQFSMSLHTQVWEYRTPGRKAAVSHLQPFISGCPPQAVAGTRWRLVGCRPHPQ